MVYSVHIDFGRHTAKNMDHWKVKNFINLNYYRTPKKLVVAST